MDDNKAPRMDLGHMTTMLLNNTTGLRHTTKISYYKSTDIVIQRTYYYLLLRGHPPHLPYQTSSISRSLSRCIQMENCIVQLYMWRWGHLACFSQWLQTR